MEDHTVMHHTFVISRTYPKPPEKVFAAFCDPAKKRRWYAEGERHDVVTFETDFSVGGTERTSYRMNASTPFPGTILASHSTHLDIVPNQRVVIAQAMSLGGRNISAALCTFELAASASGTTLTFTHQAAFFEGADGPKMREGGWNALLDRLGAELAA